MSDPFANLDNETLRALLSDFAKNWLAHDGVWFRAVEKTHGLDAAMAADTEAWGRFAGIEAKRIMKRFGIERNSGLDAVERALSRRMYAAINEFAVSRPDERTLRFRMADCRVQDARRRKGLAPFPCKPVGQVEFETFGKTVDDRVEVRCLTCPPDDHEPGTWCEWEFRLGRSSG